MALLNFTLPFGNTLPIQPWTTISPLQRHATAINNMLYDPAGHQQQTDPNDDGDGESLDYYDDYKNDPYAPPAPQPRQQQQPPPRHQPYRRSNNNNDYLPPAQQQRPQPQRPTARNSGGPRNLYLPQPAAGGRTNMPPQHQQQHQQPPQLQPPPLPQQEYYNSYGSNHQQQPQQHRVTYAQTITEPPTTTETFGGGNRGNNHHSRNHLAGGPSRGAVDQRELVDGDGLEQDGGGDGDGGDGYPSQAPTYTRVQAGAGAHTQVHAVLDYDDDGEEEEDYDEEDDGKTYKMPTVTPIQGPIFLKNGSVPVVPLFSYPTLRNGSFMQIPIWWTALSVALGLELRGDVIRGTPCVKRHNQLFCPTAGTSYPINRIESFIDENKALMRRMYGDFEMSTQYGPPGKGKRKRQTDEYDADGTPPGVPDFVGPAGSDMDEIPSPDVHGDSYFSKWRSKRQTNRNNNAGGRNAAGSGKQSAGPTPPNEKVTGRLDACESKIEIVTPYWASNSAGKVRAIVNTQHFEQAIHQEVCTKTQTGRCGGECGCEQKYKWHRLLAYDPDNDCRGIFMDWFLFPSCCVCRCDP